MKKAVKYPILVLLVGVLVTVLGPIFLNLVDSYQFGHTIGKLTVYLFIAAIIIGWIFDRKYKKSKKI